MNHFTKHLFISVLLFSFKESLAKQLNETQQPNIAKTFTKQLNENQRNIVIKLCTSIMGEKLYDPIVIIEVLEQSDITNFKTLDELVNITQMEWLRKAGTERPEIKLKSTHSQIIPMHLNKEQHPDYDIEYDYVLILGAGAKNMINRLNYVNRLLKNGLKCKSIFMLYGHRDAREDLDGNYIHYKTEKNIAQILVAEILQNMNVIFEGPDNVPKDGKRHTSKDTLSYWKEKNKLSGKEKILIISSTPFIEYQKMVAINSIKINSIIGVGGKSSDEVFNRTYLDNLARVIYELQTYHKTFSCN